MLRSIPFESGASAGTYKWVLGTNLVRIARIRGYNGSATAKLWVQIHVGTQNSVDDTDVSLPANATACLDQVEILPGVAFDLDLSYDVVTPQLPYGSTNQAAAPLIAGLSTTSGVLTAATSEASTDIVFDVEEWEHPTDPTWTVNVVTSPSAKNQLWTESYYTGGSGPHQLFELVVQNGNNNSVTLPNSTVAGNYNFLKIFAVDSASVVTGTIPWRVFVVPKNTSYPFQRIRFGQPFQGAVPVFEDANGVAHYGCTLVLDTVPGAFSGTGVSANFKYQSKIK